MPDAPPPATTPAPDVLDVARRVVGNKVVCPRSDCRGCDPDKPQGFWCEHTNSRVPVADMLIARRPPTGSEPPEDTILLDKLAALYDRRQSKVIPYIVVGEKGAVIWDQSNGLTILGQGKTLRDAIRAAHPSEVPRD